MKEYIPYILLLILSQPCFSESKTYQTTPKPPNEEHQQLINAPFISVNPDTGKTRVFITPNGASSNTLASHGAPVYHAQAFYQPTQAGISTSMIKLHQQMANACPQGWIKLQEWADLQTETPKLHYQFQCLDSPQQD